MTYYDDKGKVTAGPICWEIPDVSHPGSGGGGGGGGGGGAGRSGGDRGGPTQRRGSACDELEKLYPPGSNPRGYAAAYRGLDDAARSVFASNPAMGIGMKMANTGMLADQLLTDWNFKAKTEIDEERPARARAGNYNAGMMFAASRLNPLILVPAGGALELAEAARPGGSFSTVGPIWTFFEDTEDVVDVGTGFGCGGGL